MAVLPILRWPDPRLSTPCTAVGDPEDEVRRLAEDMLETMYAAPGRGLAAPQVGVLRRVFVMDTAWRDGMPAPRVIIDPVIVWMSDARRTGPEGCLSIPGVTAEVDRAAEIRLSWTTLDGRRVEELLTGPDAVCAQHEFDHLEGLVTFDRLEPDRRAALEAAYSGALA